MSDDKDSRPPSRPPQLRLVPPLPRPNRNRRGLTLRLMAMEDADAARLKNVKLVRSDDDDPG
jgi:hypothetical protein